MARPTPGELIQAALEPGLKGGIAANRTARVLKALTDAGYVFTDLNTIRDHEVSPAARDVLAERRRQIEVEGWTPEHDDTHSKGEMASAAACYATELDLWTGYEQADRKGRATLISAERVWPWSGWWKPTDRRRNLVKAGALILAEIERIDRAVPSSSDRGGE